MITSPLARVFLSGAQQELMGRGSAVFTYHKIGVFPRGSRDPFLYSPIDIFDSQLRSLAKGGFQAVRLGQMLERAGDRPQKVVITFDDGFRNVFENALESLDRHKAPAIQFVVSNFIGKQNTWDTIKGDLPEALMDTEQIKDWLGAGHEIGSHSATHPNLKKLSTPQAREEISASKKSLEDRFGIAVRHFCYPFGGWTEKVRELVAEAGYHTACTVEFGVVNPIADPLTLPRIIPLSTGALLRKALHRLWRRTIFRD